MTVIDWLISVDRSLLPIYSVAIMLIGLYGYLKPEKEEKQEPSYTEPQTINSLCETYFTPTISDILLNLPSVEECPVVGIYRGHRVIRVNKYWEAGSYAKDDDYVVYGDSLYLCKNNELILIKPIGEM